MGKIGTTSDTITTNIFGGNLIESVLFAKKIVLLEDMNAFVRKQDLDVKQVCVGLGSSWQAVGIILAGGEKGVRSDIRPLARLDIAVVVGRGGVSK